MTALWQLSSLNGEWFNGDDDSIAVGKLYVGSQIFRRYTLRDKDGVLADAATFTVTITAPDASAPAATVAHPSVGVYVVTWPVFTMKGVWHYKAQAAGDPDVVERLKVLVYP